MPCIGARCAGSMQPNGSSIARTQCPLVGAQGELSCSERVNEQ